MRVYPCPADISKLYHKPSGPIEDVWPSTQLTYLGTYLQQLGCKTVIIEEHYIDRDYIYDVTLYYARSLRAYPNYCQRIHFFSEAFDDAAWRRILTEAAAGGEGLRAATATLQHGYLGFTVVRPLAGFPIGRTVLKTVGATTKETWRREFTCVRDYTVHLAGYELHVSGLAFQQQDRGVSACATTALWSALHHVSPIERLPAVTPAEITEAASRYSLNANGRSLPSEGLNIQQVCEAIRAAGLAPLVIQRSDPVEDKAQLLGYSRSGFASVLAVGPVSGATHAVCTVGLKVGSVQPATNPPMHFLDAATAVRGLYIHDDRLGPYASVELFDKTVAIEGAKPPQPTFRLRTGMKIRWPDGTYEADEWMLHAVIVPVPVKLRLTIARIRSLGYGIAEATGLAFAGVMPPVQLDCRYRLATDYRASAFGFRLSDAGLYQLTCETVLSRYVGAVEISSGGAALFDVLLDTTENVAHRALLACVRREGLPDTAIPVMRTFAKGLETVAIV
ncbi:MAG TPA: hypothetical protein VF865_01295 [Acidobacteriaceae bacterium]